MSFFKINSSHSTSNVCKTQQSTLPKAATTGAKQVKISIGQQNWVSPAINASDYTSMSGLRKHYSISDYSLQQVPKECIEANGGAGSAFIGKKEINLDEVTTFQARNGNSYGAIGIKHTSDGDEIYIHENRNGFNITSKYVNGNLVHVEKISDSSPTHSGIMPYM